MTIIGFATSKHKPIKLCYLFACLIIMVSNALTDARTSFIMLAFMISGTLCIGLWTIIYRKGTIYTRKKKSLVIIVLLVCFSVCFYGAVETQRLLGTGFISIRDKGNIVISSAKAEAPSVENEFTPNNDSNLPEFDQRDVWISENTEINEALSHRLELWQNAFGHIHRHPQTIIYGNTIDGTFVSKVVLSVHSHNILIQHLIEGGIIALSLYLSFIVYGIFHTFRLWNQKNIPFWQRLLPLPVFSIFLWEMAECVSHFSFGHPPMTLFWFFLGATITVSKSLEKYPKASEQPAIPAESAVTETGE